MQEWIRMDMVYNAHSDADRPRPEGNIALLKVHQYCVSHHHQMERSGEFDRRDLIAYLNWAIDWFSKFEPRADSPEESDKDDAIVNLTSQRERLVEEEMRMRIRRHERFRATVPE